MIHKAFSSRTLINVSHPDLIMARLQLPWLCQSRGFNEKTQRRRKTRRTEPGNVYSSIDSSKIVHFFFFFFLFLSTREEPFAIDLVMEHVQTSARSLVPRLRNDPDERSLKTKILLFPPRVSPFQRLSVFLKYLPSLGLLDILVGRLRKSSTLCNVVRDTL